MQAELKRLSELIAESDARKDEEIKRLKSLASDLLKAGDECSKAPHYIVQPFINIVKEHQQTILKHNLFKLNQICPRCDLVVEECQNSGWIDGEVAHTICVMEELDEEGMDDFNGCND